MDEIEKFRELLGLLDQLKQSGNSASAGYVDDPLSGEGNDEEAYWASLLLGMSSKTLDEARYRACRGGLVAISRFIADRETA